VDIFDKLWIYDIPSSKWLTGKCNSSKNPKARAGHTLTEIPSMEHGIKKYILFGGWDGTRINGREMGAENDLWLLRIDIQSNDFEWTEYILKNPPIPRDCHSAVFTGCLTNWNNGSFLENLIVIFGGTDVDFKYLNDFYILNLEGIIFPGKLFNLAIMSVIKNSKFLLQQKGFDTLPIDIRNSIHNQVTFLRLKKQSLQSINSQFNLSILLNEETSNDNMETTQTNESEPQFTSNEIESNNITDQAENLDEDSNLLDGDSTSDLLDGDSTSDLLDEQDNDLLAGELDFLDDPEEGRLPSKRKWCCCKYSNQDDHL